MFSIHGSLLCRNCLIAAPLHIGNNLRLIHYDSGLPVTQFSRLRFRLTPSILALVGRHATFPFSPARRVGSSELLGRTPPEIAHLYSRRNALANHDPNPLIILNIGVNSRFARTVCAIPAIKIGRLIDATTHHSSIPSAIT